MRKRLGQDNTSLGFSCYINPIIKSVAVTATSTAREHRWERLIYRMTLGKQNKKSEPVLPQAKIQDAQQQLEFQSPQAHPNTLASGNEMSNQIINDTVTASGDHHGETAILLIKNHNSNTTQHKNM